MTTTRTTKIRVAVAERRRIRSVVAGGIRTTHARSCVCVTFYLLCSPFEGVYQHFQVRYELFVARTYWILHAHPSISSASRSRGRDKRQSIGRLAAGHTVSRCVESRERREHGCSEGGLDAVACCTRRKTTCISEKGSTIDLFSPCCHILCLVVVTRKSSSRQDQIP